MKKNYKYRSFQIVISFIFLVSAISSCKKFVDIDLTPNRLYAPYIFDDNATLVTALNGAYSALAASTSDAFIKPALFADELFSSSDLPSSQNTYTAFDNPPYSFFANYYKVIYDANFLLEGLQNAPAISPDTAQQVKGECLFLRAFSHFQLVNYYGTPPLVTVTNFHIAAYVGNTPADVTYASIISDLKTAADLLPDAYPTTFNQRVRINKQTVNTLLAKVYLYRQDWANAIDAANKVIESGIYSLNTDVNNVFIKTSNETIWQYYNQNGVTPLGTLIPSSPGASTFTYTVRDTLVKSFDTTNDLRFKAWIHAGTNPTAHPYYAYKYKIKTLPSTGPGNEYLVQFRLAELYLIRAEAYAQTNDITNGLADLNVTRNRAGLTTPLSVSTSTDLLDAVAEERKKELMFESGNRWFDLKRTGKLESTLTPIKPGFQSFRALLPYNANNNGVIGVNPNIVQNPGY